VFGHLLMGLVDLAAGVIALVWPLPTALVLILVVGLWAFAGGFLEIFAAFRPGIGAVTIALLFGLFSLVYGWP
jgi:uncharacterized membrane protein HdeD (DUF308 family)